MDNNSKDNYIKDAEFDAFLEIDFEERFEEDLKSTPIGIRILMLQKMGLDINLKKITQKYISKAGYTMEPTGHIYIEEDVIQEVYGIEEQRLSEELKIDLSRVNDPQKIQRLVNEVRHIESVDRIGVEATMNWYNLNEDFKDKMSMPDIKEALKPIIDKINGYESENFRVELNSYMSTTDLKDALNNLGMTKEEIEDKVNQIEKDTINCHINKKETVQMIRLLYKLREIRNDKDENANQEEIENIKKQLQEIMGEAEYTDRILDENGEIDLNRAVEFLKDWEENRNKTKLFEHLTKAHSSITKQIKPSSLPQVLIIMGQACRGDDEINKEIAISIAKELQEKMGLQLLDENGELDLSRIADNYRTMVGQDVDFQQIMENSEWNASTASGKLDRIDDYIDIDHGIMLKTRDEVNDAKAAYEKVLEKIKAEKTENFAQIVEANNLSKEQIVALFYKYRKEEWNKKGEFGPRQLTAVKEHGTAQIIYNYITSHPETFGEFLSERKFLLGVKVNELVTTHEFSEAEKTSLEQVSGLIDSNFATIETRKDIHIELSNELDELLKKYIGIHKDDISDEDRDLIFGKAVELAQKGKLSHNMKQQLIRIDKRRFIKECRHPEEETLLEGLQVTVSSTLDSLGKFISDFSKNVIPADFLQRVPLIKEPIKKDNRVTSFFKKVFSREKQQQLPEASKLNESDGNILNDMSNIDQRPFDLNKKYDIDHAKALEQISSSSTTTQTKDGVQAMVEEEEVQGLE